MRHYQLLRSIYDKFTVVLLTVTLLIFYSCISNETFVATDSNIKWGASFQGDPEHTFLHNGIYLPLNTSGAWNLVFYHDGTVIFMPTHKNTNIINYLKDIVEAQKGGKKGFNSDWKYGIYRASSNKIEVNLYEYYSLLSRWHVSHLNFEIVSNKQIRQTNLSFYTTRYTGIPYADIFSEPEKVSVEMKDDYCFLETDYLPDSMSYLKERKWMWNSTDEWRCYMKSVGKKSK